MQEMIFELKRKLIASVKRNRTRGLLFSGGLDSAILAGISPDVKAVTVSLMSRGEDIKYASSVVETLNLEHYQRNVDLDEAIDSIPEVIRILRTFDPAIPNDIVVYFGLKQAKEMGIEELMTGDGSDELFAGYSFMKDIDPLDDYIKKISSSLRFSSNDLGDYFDIGIKQPYLDREIVDLSHRIEKDLKIKLEDGKVWGKWILRKAFEDMFPGEVIWQDKRPLEYGSGMTRIREIISSKVSDEEFSEANRSLPVKFMNKEHFYYYRIYMEEVGEIPGPEKGQKACGGCGAGMNVDTFHCKICGSVSDWKKSEDRGQKSEDREQRVADKAQVTVDRCLNSDI